MKWKVHKAHLGVIRRRPQTSGHIFMSKFCFQSVYLVDFSAEHKNCQVFLILPNLVISNSHYQMCLLITQQLPIQERVL